MHTLQNVAWNKMHYYKRERETREKQKQQEGMKKVFKLLFIQTFKSITRRAATTEIKQKKSTNKSSTLRSSREDRRRSRLRSVANIEDKPDETQR